MSIIKCPECGKDISDKAAACIYCGYPINKVAESELPESSVSNNEEQDLTPVTDISTAAASDQASEKTRPLGFLKKVSKKLVAVLAIVALIIVIAVMYGNQLNENEQHVYDVVSDYKARLKDPDSLVLRSDILYVVTKDYDKYVVFSASGNNSYGAPVTSMPMYMNFSYIGEYGDEPADLDDIEDKLNLARGNLIVASWRLVGSNLANEDDYLEAELISGKKISSKLHCEWKE